VTASLAIWVRSLLSPREPTPAPRRHLAVGFFGRALFRFYVRARARFRTRYIMCERLRMRARDRSLARPKEVSNHNRDPVGYSTRRKLGQDVSGERPGAARPNPTPARRPPRTLRGPCGFRDNAHGPRAAAPRTPSAFAHTGTPF